LSGKVHVLVFYTLLNWKMHGETVKLNLESFSFRSRFPTKILWSCPLSHMCHLLTPLRPRRSNSPIQMWRGASTCIYPWCNFSNYLLLPSSYVCIFSAYHSQTPMLCNPSLNNTSTTKLHTHKNKWYTLSSISTEYNIRNN